MKKVGVLAVQGAFIEHENILNRIGVETFEIRQKKDLERDFDGLIIPGGESTVIGKLARELDMQDTLVKKINDGMPVFGTCAGLLVLAKKIENDDRVHFATMDIVAKRNAYGRQLSIDVGIPADLKDIVKEEDVQFLAESAVADACAPGNPKDASLEDIIALYHSLM